MSEFKLISPQTLAVGSMRKIDWKLCLLCQKAKQEALKVPLSKPAFDPEKNSLRTLSITLKDFEEINELPKHLKNLCGDFSDSTSLYDELISNNATIHKSCSSEYNKQKYLRKKRKFDQISDTIEAKEENEVSAVESGSSSVSKSTRRSVEIKTFSASCYFCERNEDVGHLHNCQTMSISEKVKSIAVELGESKLLAKLSQGDMVATEAKYHKACLTKLMNKYRSLSKRCEEDSGNDFIEGIALSALISNLEEQIADSAPSVPVFMLKDLKIDFQAILRRLGASQEHVDRVNVTRLKHQIMASIPGLIEKKRGKFVILTTEIFGETIYEASIVTNRNEGVIISKAAKIVRKYMFNEPVNFEGNLSYDHQKSSVPVQLLHLLGLILEGAKDYNTLTDSTEGIALNLAQLLRFNAVKTKRSTLSKTKNMRRRNSNETPFPVQVGLSLHAKTREKSVIEFLSKRGLCITYDRVLEIEDTITAQVCKFYEEEDTICPPSMVFGDFTIAAIDNIDHNPTSSTANQSFHGTSVSVFQFPDTQQPKIKSFEYKPESVEGYNPKLPKSYTEILPTKEANAEVPKKAYSEIPHLHENREMAEEMEAWKKKLATFDATDPESKASFVGFFSREAPPKIQITRSALLPLLSDSINSAAMVRHCMETIQKLTYRLNPGQMVVLTADQPVYAIGKQVQWNYPGKYKNVFWMMGPLHIEMALMSTVGDWLEGSGWTEILKKAGTSTTGRIENFLSGKKVKQTRYAHLVTLAALCRLEEEAFKDSGEDDYEVWKDSNINRRYWSQVMLLEMSLFQLLKSLRNADFELFRSSLGSIMPWMFALNHTHYARWLSVFVQDLHEIDPSLLESFKDGKFVVRKSESKFSCIGVDHAHEQNNKLIKIKGGAVGILDNENALLRWAVAGPILMDLCGDDKQSRGSKHHEDNDCYEKKFNKNVLSLVAAFNEYGNPFAENIKDRLVQVVSKTLMDDEASNAVKTAFTTGKQQFKEFLESRLQKKEVSLHAVISRNKFTVFRERNLTTSKTKANVALLKADRKLFSRLYIACQSRKGDLDNFFCHENHSYPVSISEYGRLRKCNGKSDFLKCLNGGEHPQEDVSTEVIVVDGAAFVNMNAPKGSSTFLEYCTKLSNKALFIARGAKRIDMCFDVYKPDSLKQQTRENRGPGIRTVVRENTPIPKDFKAFMRNDENKTEFFGMLAETLAGCRSEIQVVATIKDQVLSNQLAFDKSLIADCNHEEADTRVLLHAFDAASKGSKSIKIITVDTDVVVIALYHFFSLQIDELWIEFGVEKNKKFIPIHEYAKDLGEEICRALPFWFCLTGCDTVSMFSHRGKITAWQVWDVLPEVTKAFVSLSHADNLSPENFQLVQLFVVLLYDRSSSCEDVNTCRRVLFTVKNRDMEMIPPTQDALWQHILRAMLQCYIWCCADQKVIPQRDPLSWGWKKEDKKFIPRWVTLSEAAKSCSELVKCGCKTRCQGRCGCKRAGMVCTELCSCGGDC